MIDDSKKPVCIESLKVLGDFWTMMIINKLSGGPLRFRELELQIDGVNSATLTNRLKAMHAAGLVERREQSRADVSYSLTDVGQKAIAVLEAVNDFSEYVKNRYSNNNP